MVFGVLGAKFGLKNVRNLRLFAFLRAFCALLTIFERRKIVETKFNKGGMSALRALITNYELLITN